MTGRLRNIFYQNFPGVQRRDIFFWLLVIFGSSLVGLLITCFSFREGIDFGDGSTFFQFAHNLSHGEVIYKDFIHFRTPGSYFLQSFFITIFGDQQSSVRFALGFESHVLYVFFFALAVAIFFRFRRNIVGAVSVLLIIALPQYLQLRTALAFLAIVLYIQTFRSTKNKRIWYVIAGVFTGLAFTFGQEAALMAILTIGLIELSQLKAAGIRSICKTVGWLLLGFIIGVLPLLLYILLLSDISTFLYYTLYYAFIIQPNGMNLVYPSFNFGNLIFYIVPILYVMIFFVLYLSKRTRLAEVTLLTFGIFRLITLLGRSDIGHLIFVLPELLLISIVSIASFKGVVLNKKIITEAIIYSILLMLSFYIAIHYGSIYLLLTVGVIVIAFRRRRIGVVHESANLSLYRSTLFALSGLFAILLYLLYPYYQNTIDYMSRRGLTSVELGGVNVDQEQYDEVMAMKDAVAPFHPTTIFSYPIQPYYYSLASRHASRFLTFEPQTTELEQTQTMQDLKKNKPEVIIYDSTQAESLDGVLGKINHYIMGNYEIKTRVGSTKSLWVMIPK